MGFRGCVFSELEEENWIHRCLLFKNICRVDSEQPECYFYTELPRCKNCNTYYNLDITINNITENDKVINGVATIKCECGNVSKIAYQIKYKCQEVKS